MPENPEYIENPFVLLSPNYENFQAPGFLNQTYQFSLQQNKNLFNTNPDYYNQNSSGTMVEYYIQFCSNPSTFVSMTSLEGYRDLSSFRRSFSGFSEVLVIGDSEYYLSGTLPQKANINVDTTLYSYEEAVSMNINQELGSVVFNIPEDEFDIYNTATTLITRYDSATDLTELLFVSSGTNISMTNDVFLREFNRLLPDFYDENNTNPQPSGWGVAFIDSSDYEGYLYAFRDEKPAFTGKHIEYLTAPPLVYFDTNIDNVYTSENGNTVAGYLSVDFRDKIKSSYTRDDFLNINEPAISTSPIFFIFLHDIDYEPTALFCVTQFNQKQLSTKATQPGYYAYAPNIHPLERQTMRDMDIKMQMYWADLVII